ANTQMNRVQLVDVRTGAAERTWLLPARPMRLARVPRTPYVFAAMDVNTIARLDLVAGTTQYLALSAVPYDIAAGEAGEVLVSQRDGVLVRLGAESLTELGRQDIASWLIAYDPRF